VARKIRPVSARERVDEVLDLHRARLDVRPPVADGGRYVAPEHVELIEAPDGADDSDRASYPRLVATPADFLSKGRHVSPSEDCLIGFIDLAHAPVEAFSKRALAFARLYGLLELCRHLEPCRHDTPSCQPLRLWDRPDLPLSWEPLASWRRYSRQLGAILCLAANLQNELPGDPRDWQTVFETTPNPVEDGTPAWFPRWPPGDVNRERTMVSNLVTRWLGFADVRTVSIWRPTEDRPFTLLWRHPSLIGLLAVQLDAAVQSKPGVYRCAECRRPFTLPEGSRRRTPTRDAYCTRPGCGRKANNRRNQRRYQERQKGLAADPPRRRSAGPSIDREVPGADAADPPARSEV